MSAKADIQNDLKTLDSAKASLRAPPLAGRTSKDVFGLFAKQSIFGFKPSIRPFENHYLSCCAQPTGA